MLQVNEMNAQTDRRAAVAGSAVYSKGVLSIYDLFVLGFANTFIWKCPTRLMLDFYNEHVSANHLDVGVGTGYFLDKCQCPTSHPRIALLDLNPNSLERTARRLRRYAPTAIIANALEPIVIEPPAFDSIGLNYLLHCLPGTMRSKEVVFRNLKPHLNGRGVVFGSTILGRDVKHGFLARRLMRIYNSRQIFNNLDDNLADLESILAKHFRDHSIRVVGCAALFWGRT